MHEGKRIYKEDKRIRFATSMRDALVGADALAIVTEWKEFRTPDFPGIKTGLKNPLIFDGRNLYVPQEMKQQGIEYYGIGRPQP
jgi:UDPglucose 6-dehydrogenase